MTIPEVIPLGSLILLGACRKVTSTFASSSSGHLPLVPCRRPGPGSNSSRPGAVATAVQMWGTAASLRPRHPDRDRRPAPIAPPVKPRGPVPGNRNGSRRRSREVEQGQSSSRPRAWRRTFLLNGRRPRTSVGQPPTHRPPCDSPSPSPRHHSRRRLAILREPLPLGPRPDAGAPGTRPPLLAPGGKPGDGTPTPPVSIWFVRKFFQKIISDKFGDIPPTPQ